jgi:hypothetical protein
VPRFETRIDLLDTGERLSILFDADDPDPWATISEPDGDLWTEEVVELFVAPGVVDPQSYFEFEVNPIGAVFTALVRSPHGDRRDLEVDRSWICADLVATTERRRGGWRARLDFPWSSVSPDGRQTGTWRMNLYRIERPRRGPAEYSAWSPTLIEPAEFHRPRRFGFVERVG